MKTKIELLIYPTLTFSPLTTGLMSTRYLSYLAFAKTCHMKTSHGGFVGWQIFPESL